MLTNKEKQEIIEEIKKDINGPKKVYIETCRDGVELPSYATKGSSGMDIRAAEDVTIGPGETKIVPTGLQVAIPDGYEIQIRPRSGVSYKTPLRVANAPGTIDSDYRGEIGVIIHNIAMENVENCFHSINEKGNSGTYIINKGDRIAQMILCKYEEIEFEQVEKGKVKTLGLNRGGGFGSTGVN